MAEETKAPAPAKAKTYRFKGGHSSITHPSMRITITVDELKNPMVIQAIKKEDARGRTKGWFDAHIEEA